MQPSHDLWMAAAGTANVSAAGVKCKRAREGAAGDGDEAVPEIELPAHDHALRWIQAKRSRSSFINPTNADLLRYASTEDEVPMVVWLLTRSAGLVRPTHAEPDEAELADRRTALGQACQHGQLDLLKWLCACGGATNDDMVAPQAGGKTLLHSACAGGHVRVLDWLYERGLGEHVNTKNKLGATPMHWACFFRRLESCRWLLAHGVAPVDLVSGDREAWSPFYQASVHEEGLPICQLFLLVCGPGVLRNNRVLREMSTSMRRQLVEWAEAQVKLYLAFRRTVLFGMRDASGSPHLSRLAGVVGLRMLVARFLGVPTTRQHDNLVDALPEIRALLAARTETAKAAEADA